MVLFKILSGKKAGASWAARRFPVRVGRAPANDLQLEDAGIWDEHLLLSFQPQSGFLLSTRGEALASVNGQPVQETLLRNGDTLQLGSVRLQFWLADTRQSGLLIREWLTWTAIAGICLGQVGIIYWLLR